MRVLALLFPPTFDIIKIIKEQGGVKEKPKTKKK